MAGIKYEEQIPFPDGTVYVLMDDEWGVSVTGEDGIGGDLTGMISWDFNTRAAWLEWGATVITHINDVKVKFDNGIIGMDEITELIYDIENRLPEHIQAAVVSV